MEKNASILVVDDDKEIADLVEIYLVNDGYQVLKASDGEQCLETLKQHPEVRMRQERTWQWNFITIV